MSKAERIIHAPDEAAMLDLGRRLGERATVDRLVMHLHGDLGAGKTTLVRGFLAGAGYHGRVKSPTYTLMEPYPLPSGEAVHLDLYRLADPEELEFLGLRDLDDRSRWLFIEWPEKGEGHLPAADIVCSISFATPGRDVRLATRNTSAARWLEGISLPDTSR